MLVVVYKMKNTLILLLLACTSGFANATLYHPRPDAIWQLIAESHVIVTGTLSVPVANIRSCLNSNQHEYVEIGVTREQVLKGRSPKTFKVRWYTRPSNDSPTPESIITLNGKEALLFLVEVEGDLYFAGYTPRALSKVSETQIEQIQREVIFQQELLSDFSKEFPPSEEPLYTRIKNLIDATTRKDSQMNAFRELEELGISAVPAIIMLMDDRRDLAVPAISLQNHPGHWESVRHYGPKKVVDALAAILNQITSLSFGSIYNSGSEKERQNTVNGWRIYLYHWKKHQHNKAFHGDTESHASEH